MEIAGRWLCVVLAGALAAMTVGLPDTAQAQWHQEGDLPGLMSGGEVLLYALGVAAVVTIVVLVAKSSDADEPDKAEDGEEKKDEDTGEPWEDSSGSLGIGLAQPRYAVAQDSGRLPASAEDQALKLIAGIAPDPSTDSGVALRMGVQFAF